MSSRRDAFDGVLAALHEAAFDDACWPVASARIDEACRIKGNMLVYGGGASHADVAIYLARLCYRGERDEALERRYFEEYYARDERVPRLRALPESRLVHVRELYTEEEKRTSAAYNEALPLSDTQHSLSLRLNGPNGSRIVWSFANPVEGDCWSFDQVDMIERLLPHLSQYVRVRQVLADRDGLTTSLATLLHYSSHGVIELDRKGRIVEMNERARAILTERGGLFDRDGFLCARASVDHDHLQRLLARALPPTGGQGASGSMVVTHSPGSRPVLHIAPVGGCDGEILHSRVAALVLVVDPNSQPPIDSTLVAAALGLSPAESRVAALLADGHAVRDIAVATGRSENTIRWHIRRIFEKHGLTRLVQLVQLVRSLAAPSANMS